MRSRALARRLEGWPRTHVAHPSRLAARCGERLRMTAVGVVALLGAYCLDIVAVGIEQERSVIGRAVVGAGASAAIVAAASLQALGVEALDRGMIEGAERDMGAGAFGILVGVKPQRRLAFRSKARAAVVARAQHIAQRF